MISHEDVAAAVHCHAPRRVETAGQGGDCRRGGDAAIDRQNLFHRIAAPIGDEDVAAAVHRHCHWIGESASQCALRSRQEVHLRSNSRAFQIAGGKHVSEAIQEFHHAIVGSGEAWGEGHVDSAGLAGGICCICCTASRAGIGKVQRGRALRQHGCRTKHTGRIEGKDQGDHRARGSHVHRPEVPGRRRGYIHCIDCQGKGGGYRLGAGCSSDNHGVVSRGDRGIRIQREYASSGGWIRSERCS